MPSFLELLESGGPDRRPSAGDVGGAGAPIDVLASVKAEGLRRRRHRRRRNLAVSGLVVVALAAPALALLPGGEDRADLTVAADQEGDATSTTREPIEKTEPTLPTEVLGVVLERPESAVTTATTARPRPTTTTSLPAVACHNSTNSSCGAFHWSPAPSANQPLLLSADPVGDLDPGQQVTITVHWSDGDAQLTFHDTDADDGVLLAEACSVEERYGAWTPPAADGGSGSFTITYTAPDIPGTYTVTVAGSTAICDGYHPYRSEDTLTIALTVVAPPETTTTTEPPPPSP